MTKDRTSETRTSQETAGDDTAAVVASQAALPQGSYWRWDGGTGDWYDAADWSSSRKSGGSYPQPGDNVDVTHGTVILAGNEAKDDGVFDANTVKLGGGKGSPATLETQQATLGRTFSIEAHGSGRVESQGTSIFDGALTIDKHAHVTLGSEGSGDLTLTEGFSIVTPKPNNKATLEFDGNVTFDGASSLTTPSAFTVVNNAAVNVVGLADANSAGIEGKLEGTGRFNLGLASDLKTDGVVGAGQTMNFASDGAQLDIGDLKGFDGHITNFGSGDAIGLTSVGYSSDLAASYNAATSTLSVTNTSTNQTVASLSNVSAQTGPLYVSADAKDGGISIGYSASTATSLSQADIAASSEAMRANVAQTMDVPGTSTPITGAGVKIGIISSSFDNTGTAAANEAAGYLPSVNVLADDPVGNGNDEGQAMAEEIHQVAPGAQIDFCAADDGTSTATTSTLAQAVQTLQNAHCNVIVDDISVPGGSFYQVSGPDGTAVQNAVNSGVNYFTAAGNQGQSFLNQTFTQSSKTVEGSAAAQFDNGTPFERFSVGADSNTTAYLQWAAPYEGASGTGAQQDLSLEVFNSRGQYVGTSSPVTETTASGSVQVAAAELQIPVSSDPESYYFSVVRDNGAPAPSAFHVSLENNGSGSGPGGVIDDPAAGTGSDMVGAEMVPGVNTVGASFYGESAAFGQPLTANEAYSSYGADTQILYAPNGTPLATPETVSKPTFTAPDGTVTTVPSFAGGFFGTSAAAPNAAAVAALMLQANPNLTTSQVTSLLQQSALPISTTGQSGAGLIQADKAVQAAIAAGQTALSASPATSASQQTVTTSVVSGQSSSAPTQSSLVTDSVASPVCFAAGTCIRTARGEIAVESLVVGDLVVTAAGRHRAIRWLGHRSIDCRRHLRSAAVWPVKIAAHAFGDNRPARDLSVSPGHAICIDVWGEILVPAAALVDGVTIVQRPVERVTYWHVELDEHDIILAEGLPCESYLEMGNRGFFAEAEATVLRAAPDVPVASHAAFCRPFHDGGPLVAAVRHRLDARAVMRDGRSNANGERRRSA